MLERIVPPRVAVSEMVGAGHPDPGFPEEWSVVAGAAQARRQQFLDVRGCAREGLVRLGRSRAPLLPGHNGAPVWPDGVVGSLTHCEGYSGAAVAISGAVVAVGIDAEPSAALPDGVLELVADAGERTHLAGLTCAAGPMAWDRLLFSAKESVYKVWSPMTGQWLGFEDVVVRIDPRGAFTARILRDGLSVDGVDLTRLHGRWLASAGLLLTAVVVVR